METLACFNVLGWPVSSPSRTIVTLELAPYRGRGLRFIFSLAGVFLIACYGRNAAVQSDTPRQSPPTNYGVADRPLEPVPLTLRALLSWQYRNAIRDLLGLGAAAVVDVPADTTVNGWDAIGAAQLSLSPTAVDKYEVSARRAAAAAMNDLSVRGGILACGAGCGSETDCMTSFVAQFGQHAWRRPLTSDERAAWVAIGVNAAAAYGDLYKGAEFVIAGLLQSPNFLYQIEVGEPDPQHANRLRLSGCEMATRVSLFLTGSIPTEELLAAAERGELESQDGVRLWAQRLLTEPAAQEAVAHLFDELLQLRDLAQMSKDRVAFPSFGPELASAMRDETQKLLSNLIWDEDVDFRRFFRRGLYLRQSRSRPSLWFARRAGVGRDAARAWRRKARGLFGSGLIPLVDGPPSDHFSDAPWKIHSRKTSLPEHSAPSPQRRYQSSESAGLTARQRLAVHRQNPSCASCHTMMDDIGLGLENFDAIGGYRDTESSQPIDASSRLDDIGNFAGPRELGSLLTGEPRVTLCLTRNLLRAATGHVDTPGELGPLSQVHERFASSGFRLKEALVEIVASDAFRFAALSQDAAQ